MNYKIISIVSYIISCVFIGLGFHKMLVYENPESYVLDSKNTYVGGDAYNYIINANFTTAYFVLALIFVLLGSTFLIISMLNPMQPKVLENVEREVNANFEEKNK